MTVLTGVSGSGKSTLAFDIVFAEGQRRYLESLNAYARQFVQPASRPDVDAIFGIPPTVAIEQRTSRGGRKSTVGTLTEVQHFLRLLYVKLGVQHCPDCDVPIEPQSADSIAALLLREAKGRQVTLLAPLVIARKGYYTDLAKWARAKGYAHLRVDGELLPTAKWPRLDRFQEHTIELPVGTVKVGAAAEQELRATLDRALEFGKGVAHVVDRGPHARVLDRRACPSCGRSFAEPDPRLFSYNSKHGWCEDCFGTGLQISGFDARAVGRGSLVERLVRGRGDRLSRLRRAAAEPGRARGAVPRPFDRGADRAAGGDGTRLLRHAAAARPRGGDRARPAGRARVAACRSSTTSASATCRSTAPRRRSRAARRSASGSPRSSARTCRACATCSTSRPSACTRATTACCSMRCSGCGDKGNTLLVVEHDEDTIRRADHVIDLGPGAGHARRTGRRRRARSPT